MVLHEVGFEVMDWIEETQARGSFWALVNAVMNYPVPWNAENSWWEMVSLSRSTLLYAVWSSIREIFKWEHQNIM